VGQNTAAIFGKRVTLVEKPREVGGAGINTGTILSAARGSIYKALMRLPVPDFGSRLRGVDSLLEMIFY
jgi:pyruvate/2-oxoglutarate dehydrogenase complex dihydrolipoamide dehydrogenase (E3) component